MRLTGIDIETRPNPALDTEDYWQWREDELTPPSNFKDPLVIENWRGKKMQSLRDAMALEAHSGLIACIGLIPINHSQPIARVYTASEVSPEAERELLETVGKALHQEREPTRFVGYNVRRFDFPFLLGRIMVQGATWPSWFPLPRNYRDVIDLYEILGGGTQEQWQYAMGLGRKAVSGADTLQLSLEELAAHCEEDLVTLLRMAKRLTWHLGGNNERT